jgi:hypothetical protein
MGLRQATPLRPRLSICIANELSLSEKTVRNYVSRILDELGVATRPEAIVLAREAGYGRGPSPAGRDIRP